MKKLILLCCIFSIPFVSSLKAQQNGFVSNSLVQNKRNTNTSASGSEKIKQLKTVYMVKKLDLKKEEQTAFWNTYSKYENDLNNLWTKNRVDKGDFENKCKLLQNEYTSEFVKILGTQERAEKVFETDIEFRKMLRKELKGRKN